eukprot:334479-Prorocentrum_minimum.AAC.2
MSGFGGYIGVIKISGFGFRVSGIGIFGIRGFGFRRVSRVSSGFPGFVGFRDSGFGYDRGFRECFPKRVDAHDVSIKPPKHDYMYLKRTRDRRRSGSDPHGHLSGL